MSHDPYPNFRLAGVVASPGIAIGPVFVLDSTHPTVPHIHLDPDETDAELERFGRAVARSRRQIEGLLQQVAAERLGTEHAYILEAHLLMMEDPEFLESVQRRIQEGFGAEWAVSQFLDQMKDRFSRIADAYFQERGTDVDQVGERVLRNLLGRSADPLRLMPNGSLLLAHDLTPADTVELGRNRIRGFVTEVGGRTSHVSILARSLELPAVVGVGELPPDITTGDMAILDGHEGVLILHPTPEQLLLYRARRKAQQRTRRYLLRNFRHPAKTRDGVVFTLEANLELPDELTQVEQKGAEGVGMYRTEYLFLGRDTPPSEELQYEVYRALAQRLAPRPVTIRTFDLGGDKLSLSEDEGSMNPALGSRGVRHSLYDRESFRAQLRACLRASAFGTVRILIPMITTLEEIRSVKEEIQACQAQLTAEGRTFASPVPLGIMVETPAAAVMADLLATEVDFFSLGTNDLLQYTLAADRTNEGLSYLYQPLHPALLRLISMVSVGARKAGIPLSLCGEMAGEPLQAAVLAGLGLRSLSVSPALIPPLKAALRKIDVAEMTTLADQALRVCRTEAEVITLFRGALQGRGW